MKPFRSLRLGLLAAAIAAIALALFTELAAHELAVSWAPPAYVIWIVFLALAAVVIGFDLRTKSAATDQPPGRGLDAAVEELATAIKNQWRAESATRSLEQPAPIRVQWTSTDLPVVPLAGAILGNDLDFNTEYRLHGDVDSIVSSFLRLPKRQLVILGKPGGGKTVLALLLTLGLLEERAAGDPVPVLITLSSWDPRAEHLDSWLSRRIAEEYPALTRTAVYGDDAPARLVDERRVIPVLDGLDEIASDLRPKAIEGIGRAIAGDRPAVVTSRIADYMNAVDESGAILPTAAVVEIEDVTPDDAAMYLAGSSARGAERWAPVLDHLRRYPTSDAANALATPLMLWLARTAYMAPSTLPSELLDAQRFASQGAIEDNLLNEFVPVTYAMVPPARAQHRIRRYDPKRAEEWLKTLARYLHHPRRRGLRTGRPIATDSTSHGGSSTVPSRILGLR